MGLEKRRERERERPREGEEQGRSVVCRQSRLQLVCRAQLCRAARNLEREVREVYAMVRVVHLEKRQRENRLP